MDAAEVDGLGNAMLSIDLTNTSADAKIAWSIGMSLWLSGLGALALFF
jgi:hypothetical protein